MPLILAYPTCMPTFENGAEDVDVVEDGEEDEDAVEDGVELLGDEHRHRHAVPDEPRATDQDLQIKLEISFEFWMPALSASFSKSTFGP